ncbi:hypothetical protein O1L55_06215 [Streptomyces albulus]|nr:hypothetical protein [Streptomyces noursei]
MRALVVTAVAAERDAVCAALDAEDAEVAEAAPAATGPRRCPAATCCTARPLDRTGRPLPRTCWPPVSARPRRPPAPPPR